MVTKVPKSRKQSKDDSKAVYKSPAYSFYTIVHTKITGVCVCVWVCNRRSVEAIGPHGSSLDRVA